MKYNLIRKGAIYTFIVVTVVMTLLGVLAIWFPGLEGIIGKAFATVLVVGLGCILIAYSASLLANAPEKREALPSFAPHPKPVPPPANHLADGKK
jgi:predicted membrane channel-forming protein YqfA (hemolysin III family)